jgi:hypothetical protein
VWFEDRSSTDVLLCRAMDSFWLEDLSSYRENARVAREFIRWTVDIRSSGLVNGRLMMDYTPRCRSGVQVDRYPDDGLSRRVFGDFLTARMGMSVGRLPQKVLLEEFYRSECSETVRVGRVRVFGELLAVFNCAIKFHRE